MRFEMLIVCLTGMVSILPPLLLFPLLPLPAPLLMMRPIPPAAPGPAIPMPPELPAMVVVVALLLLLLPRIALLPLGGGAEVPMMGLSMPIAGGAAACVARSVGELKTFVMVIGFIVVGDPIVMSGLPMLILGDPMCVRRVAAVDAGASDLGVPVADADDIVGEGAGCPAAAAAGPCVGVVIVLGIWIFGVSFLMSFWNGLIVDPVLIGDVRDWKWLFVFTVPVDVDPPGVVVVVVVDGF